MIIDLFIIFPIIVLCVLGFRDGLVKKGIGLLVTVIALVLSQVFLDDMAGFYVEEFDIERSDAVMAGFFTVFFGLIFLQSLIYRLAAHNYKIGGIADRTVGSLLGLFQGLVIMSVIFMILALQRFPSRQYRIDSRLYTSVVNVAPMLLDFTLEVVPETTQEFKGKAEERIGDFTKPDPATPSAAEQPSKEKK
ncbi:MAG: CvpA family protein [Ignavibacteriales bacterium]|nr:CvpA family protein [Ignavibacteriales bacterium]